MRGDKDREPAICRRLTDSYVTGKGRKIKKLTGGRGGSRHKAGELYGIADLRQITNVAFNIGADIRTVEHLPVVVEIVNGIYFIN